MKPTKIQRLKAYLSANTTLRLVTITHGPRLIISNPAQLKAGLARFQRIDFAALHGVKKAKPTAADRREAALLRKQSRALAARLCQEGGAS